MLAQPVAAGRRVDPELADADDPAVGQDRDALERVRELPHVAGPVVQHQRGERGRPQRGLRQTVARGGARQQVEGQRRDVLAPLRKARQRDREDMQSMVEVAPEGARGDRAGEIAVGRRDDAHVDGDLALAAEPGDAVVLECPQQLDLGGQRHLADLVEEQGAAARLLEPPRVAGRRTRECAPLVAEQLGLDQRVRHRRAVERHERPVAPGRNLVEGTGEQLLAASRRPLEQHRGGGGGNPP